MPTEELERLYQVFSRYGRPVRLEGCPCCTSSAEGQWLISKPLRAVTAEELGHYAFKALSTWATLDDYKYFLPRIFELTEDGSLPCDSEIILGKLHYGGFRDWPTDERQAIRNWIFGVWREAVRTADTDRADSFLCGAAPALEDVSPFLEYADAAAPGFKAAYAAEHGNQVKRKLLNGYWERHTAPYQQVLAWL
jgi:hypothetical protein